MKLVCCDFPLPFYHCVPWRSFFSSRSCVRKTSNSNGAKRNRDHIPEKENLSKVRGESMCSEDIALFLGPLSPHTILHVTFDLELRGESAWQISSCELMRWVVTK